MAQDHYIIDDLSTKYMSHTQEVERQMLRGFIGGSITVNTKVVLQYHLDELKKIVAAMPEPKRADKS